MVNIKNYTSTVPAGTSQVKIESYLVEAGAADISKKYDPETKVCVAITFRIFHVTERYPAGVAMFFKLPAKVDACFKVLYSEVKRPRPDTKKLVMQQAERVLQEGREKVKKCCNPCGKPFLPLEKQSASVHFPFEKGICCICLKEKLVSEASNYNYPPKNKTDGKSS